MDVEVKSMYGIRGDEFSCCLLSDTSAPTANDVLTSATGFKAFTARSAGPLVAGTGIVLTEMIAVAWSTTENDAAGVAALLALAVAEYDGTPTTAPVTLIANVKIIRTVDDVVGAIWDGTNRIKTIGVRNVGATPKATALGVDLRVVV